MMININYEPILSLPITSSLQQQHISIHCTAGSTAFQHPPVSPATGTSAETHLYSIKALEQTHTHTQAHTTHTHTHALKQVLPCLWRVTAQRVYAWRSPAHTIMINECLLEAGGCEAGDGDGGCVPPPATPPARAASPHPRVCRAPTEVPVFQKEAPLSDALSESRAPSSLCLRTLLCNTLIP